MTTPLLLLHGAIGSSAQLLPLNVLLEKDRAVHVFDFPGHGGKEFPSELFSIRLFAESVVEWMDKQDFPRVDIFGYSMGGYVALYMARHFPERVGKIVTLATKFGWDEATAEKEVKMLNPEKIAEKVPKFAEALQTRHAPLDWKKVLEKTATMMLALGKRPELSPEDFKAIHTPILLSVGDRDTMVSKEETETVHQLIPGAQFQLLPDTPHPIEQVDAARIQGLISGFIPN
jgi:pimeloyl-ACP methyl ester carboxylesterase